MRALWLAAAAALSLTLYLRAAYLGPPWQVYLLKPLTTALVLLLAWTGRGATARYRAAILVGLVFSLVGDVLLMLPQDRFVAGLAAFLAAHLAYLAAFTDGVGWRLRGWPTAAYLLAGAGVVGALWGRLGDMRLPVLAYVLVILAMASQAAGRARVLRTRSSASAAAGAALFVVSDATIAIDRFGGHFAAATLVVMTTYVGAQLLIAGSTGAAGAALKPRLGTVP